MTFYDAAREAVLRAATDLERKSQEIGIMRSVDATESSQWLKEVAQRLREACTEAPMASPPGEREGAAKLTRTDGRPFRAVIVAHDWRGPGNLCVGFDGCSPELEFVALRCSEEEKKRFPVGTKFELVRVSNSVESAPGDRYGVRVTHESWATINGGPDLVGTKDQAEAAAKLFGSELSSEEEFTFEPTPYTGNDPADEATVEEFLARMKSLTSG